MAVLFLCFLLFFIVIFLTPASTHRIKEPMLTWLRGDFFFSDAWLAIVFRDDNRINFLFIINFLVSNTFLQKNKKQNLKGSEEVDGEWWMVKTKKKQKKTLRINLCAKNSPPLECVWTCQEAAMMEPRAGQTEWVEVISVKIGRILLWGRMRLVANEKGRRQSREGRGDGRLAGKQGFNRLTGLSTKSSPKAPNTGISTSGCDI